MKKILALVLALAMMLPLAAVAEGYPVSAEPIHVTGYATAGPYTKGDFNDLKMWDYMEALTNVTIEWEAAPSGQGAEKLGLMFASNTLPDVIMKTGISTTDIATYAEEGQLVAIDPYLEEYAPNFTKILEDDPVIRKSITMADGHIYGFPYLVLSGASQFAGKPFINHAALAKLGIEEPKTIAELTEAMRLFKASDYNGNGVADEIPMTSDSVANMFNCLYGTFGIATRGHNNRFFDIDPATGELRSILSSEGYKAMLKTVGEWYQEGLLDVEIFDSEIAKVTAKAEQNILFFVPCTNAKYFGSYQNDWKGLDQPLVVNAGDTPAWNARALAISANNTFITAECENPAEMVKYFDYWYSDDGIRLFFMGIEGETWEYDADGNVVPTDYVAKNPDGMNMEEAMGTYICWSGGSNPSVAEDKYFGQYIGEITVTAANNLAPYTPSEIWPASMPYTTEEAELNAEYILEIETYANDVRAQFINGAKNVDTDWDAYVDQLNKMDIEGWKELFQTALDRYNAL